jgi:plasmid stabilization system protein ParE
MEKPIILLGKPLKANIRLMVFKIEFSDEARIDLREARDYSKIAKELLSQFDNFVMEAIERLEKNPENFQKRYCGIKIVFVAIFPYSLHYILENDTVFIQRILHQKQFYN